MPELVTWAFNAGVFDDISGVKTKDGAVAWDESMISQGDKNADVWGMNEESYNQSAGDTNTDQQGLWQVKGQTAFKATGEKLISLFKAADQSTFLHEMAHVYYHDMLELAKLPNAPKQLLEDVATIEEWAKWDEQQFDREYKGTALDRISIHAPLRVRRHLYTRSASIREFQSTHPYGCDAMLIS